MHGTRATRRLVLVRQTEAARDPALPQDRRGAGLRCAVVSGGAKWLVVEQKVCVETDPGRARLLGRKELVRYMGLPNYRNNWLRIGFTEADLENGGSDHFIDAMVNWGDAATIKAKLKAAFRR